MDQKEQFQIQFDFGLFLSKIFKFWWLLLILFVICIGLAFIKNRYSPRIYAVESTLQLGGQNNNSTNLFQEQSINNSGVEADLAIMSSSYLIEKVLQRMDIEVTYQNKGRILNTFLYKSAPFRIKVIEKDLLKNNGVYNFNYKGKGVVEISNGDWVVQCVSGDTLNHEGFKFMLTNVNASVLEEEVEDQNIIFYLTNYSALASAHKRSLNVSLANVSANLVRISFSHPNQQYAIDFVNVLRKTFVEFDLERKRKSSSNILDFIDDQLLKISEDLADYELKLNSFKSKNKINNIDYTNSTLLDDIKIVEEELMEREFNFSLLNEIEAYLVSDDNSNLYQVVAGISGTEFEKNLKPLLDNLIDLLIQRDQELFKTTEKNNVIVRLDRQINVQKDLILKNLTKIKDRENKRIAQQKNKLRGLEIHLYALPEQEKELASLNRMVNIKEKYYMLLLDKKTEFNINEKKEVSELLVLEETKGSNAPVSPNTTKNYVFAFIAFLILSFVLVTLFYVLDGKIHKKEDITNILNYKDAVIGMIPFTEEFNQKVSPIAIRKNDNSSISEAFRHLRTNIQFLNSFSNEGPNVIGTTSTISGEGKTFISLNLATILSFMGKKVLIIDMDLRNPKINKSLKLKGVGMSEFLSGAIDRPDFHNIQENCDVIISGAIPPNPSELILNGRLVSFVSEMKTKYDIVIIDTPPIGLVADAKHILQLADVPLYTVRADYSKKTFLKLFVELNKEEQGKLRVVFNGVKSRAFGSSYGYGYGYGYGYYKEDKNKKWFKKFMQ